MIMRDASNRAVSISVDPDARPRSDRSDISRRASARQLEDPSHYALVAWGLLERIRSHRERARLTITELAVRCDLDAGHLSRVEAGKANLSLEALVRIARFLQINVADLVPRAARPWRVEPLVGTGGASDAAVRRWRRPSSSDAYARARSRGRCRVRRGGG